MTVSPLVYSGVAQDDNFSYDPRKVQFAEQQLILRAIWSCFLCLVMFASLLPLPPSLSRALMLLHISDKLLHFMAYFPLAMIPALHERRLTIKLTLIGLFTLGVLLEMAQSYSGVRYFAWADILADSLGLAAGFLAGTAVRRLAAD